jgi:hypothetical protein
MVTQLVKYQPIWQPASAFSNILDPNLFSQPAPALMARRLLQ